MSLESCLFGGTQTRSEHNMYMHVKRIIDILLSLIGMIILSPIILLLIIAIKIDSRGPVLFKKKRSGNHKSHFNYLKFRPMKIYTTIINQTHNHNNTVKIL